MAMVRTPLVQKLCRRVHRTRRTVEMGMMAETVQGMWNDKSPTHALVMGVVWWVCTLRRSPVEEDHYHERK